MVAVSETGITVPLDLPKPADGDIADDGRRVVAIALTPMELLRPGSDAETVVDDVLAACLPDPLRDDVALLAVRLNP